MAVWTVWEHDRFREHRKAERALFVRDGFSWRASLFGPLWLLAKGHLVLAVAYLVVAAGLVAATITLLGEDAVTPVTLVASLWFGFEAEGLRRWALSRRGWHMNDVVEGRRLPEAERRYYTDRLAEPLPVRAAPEPAPFGQRTPPVLGLFPEGPR
ncbi:DUF2628 domain-containing protein [Acuticoccus sp. MNP-M23]|uniref:DUF2628 domain-containing protein n=1 Tax=Acuticoccus sp. MNP-M23 TaxID=3072793 RepID=UPI002814A12D|nr:DUF2628 domain-containing protein [Acuticoccus sp. MNP-M23]WMS44180.1 DUF2628 domain-containing protein [Acuticoccus sp. MNP-M23]